MSQTTRNSTISSKPNPFEPSAIARLQRTNLLTDSGTANIQAVVSLAVCYAGLLFDALCDKHDSCDPIFLVRKTFLAAQSIGMSKRDIFINICYQYDLIRYPHPEIFWWISGNDEVLPHFVDAYIAKFTICCTDLEQEVMKNDV